METIKINLKKITKNEIDLIIGYLKRGKIIVYPTDTIYGLGCLATNRKAINRIFKIKGRERRKPLLILVNGFKMLKKYCFVSKEQEKYLAKIWKSARPASVILRKKGNLPAELTAGGETIAVRLPKVKFLIKILNEANKPIVSTSLNLSGQKSLDSVSRLDNYFKKRKPDLIIDAGVMKAKPSRLIDVRDLKNIVILRR
ncbi:MAG: L-threonylcarbamoyladenylate synthase [Patescibacteria group bacterium]|nr:L-threonylcarbamoyladenylate synthase [Patescibacteria group bacterium]MDD5295173.1 L-threonylcarbamoyladenylate synthase [Patescibacteria group bacterium]MDD5554814.1 L-threonylcarbamoyladenylate synthase [Patescibacteria group bacterium]